MTGDYDERLERIFAQLRSLGAAAEAVAFGEMELALEATPDAPSFDANRPSAPGEFHPYYEDRRRWLTHWLDNETSSHVRLPVQPVMRSIFDPGPDPMRPYIPRDNVLHRQRAWGVAPYVGDPFVYVWHVAVDEYGRWVAGNTSIQYLPGGAW